MAKARATTLMALLLLSAAVRAAGRQADGARPYRLSPPDKSWALDFTLPAPDPAAAAELAARGKVGLSSSPVETLSEDGRVYLFSFFHLFGGKSASGASHITIRLMPARAVGVAEDFRAYALRRLSGGSGVKAEGLKTWEYKHFPLARYRAALSFGVGPLGAVTSPSTTSGLRTAEAFLVKDDVWITFTLMSTEFGAREERLLYELLDSVRFADTSAPSSSFDFYHRGRVLYTRRDYRRAAEALASALALERRERRLDTASWRGLVSDLVDSYGAAGDVVRVKEVLDYAARSDPAYSPFHYALARYYAGLGDLDNVIASLEKAFLRQVDRGQAPPLPDPAKDPAFEQFRKDDKFRKALKTLKK